MLSDEVKASYDPINHFLKRKQLSVSLSVSLSVHSCQHCPRPTPQGEDVSINSETPPPKPWKNTLGMYPIPPCLV